MKVIGLDNKQYSLSFTNYIVHNNDIRKRSSLHLRTRQLLQNITPLCSICEEMPLPGTSNLVLDFFIPNLMIAIECQGEQHFKFIPHFHGSVMGFMNSRKRDRQKAEWCERNNIHLCELPYNESDEQWKQRIINR